MGTSRGSTATGRSRALLVLAIGLLATGLLAFSARVVHRTSEDEMLDQRADEAVRTLDAVLPLLQIPLNSGLAVAHEGADPARSFQRVTRSFVGPNSLMHSASLWRLTASGAERVASFGERSTLDGLSPAERARRLRGVPAGGIGIVDLTDQGRRSVGFGQADGDGDERLVAYLEAPLSSDPTALDLTGDAFDDLDIAVYLGPGTTARHLLFATTRRVPLATGSPRRQIPWGDAELELVFAPNRRLGDPLLAQLPLLILATGLTLAAGFALLTQRLERARRSSDRLADENESLYLEQRTLARRLQHDLLPDPLPRHPGVDLASRYEAGADGVEIGGDWYDVVPLDDDRVIVTVGDVSGQGLPAATIMVELRTAIRAYATDGHGPAEILEKLGRLLDVRTDGHFATVLCVSIHVGAQQAILASAGHPSPVLAGPDRCQLVPLPVGYPIGVAEHATYEEAILPLDRDMTLVCFTDGLCERRGETIDVGLERVRRKVEELADQPLSEVAARLTQDLVGPDATDDTAVIAVRLTPGDEPSPHVRLAARAAGR